jgi:hypothetical protein
MPAEKLTKIQEKYKKYGTQYVGFYHFEAEL